MKDLTLQIRVTLTNLVTGKDTTVTLPMDCDELNARFADAEHIIACSDVILFDEYESIGNVNEFVQKCNEVGVDATTLRILDQVCTMDEIRKHLENDDYIIVNLDKETKKWACCGDDAKGLCLHKLGLVKLPFEDHYMDDMEDYIDWEAMWRDANCSGWTTAYVDCTTYLVKV